MLFAVKKKVRSPISIESGAKFRDGIDILQGLKPNYYVILFGTTKVVP
jgi:hypothetical protein